MLCGEALSPGVCPALRLFVALAELPQASKWRKWRLRNFRKHQNGENGVCGTSASIKMEKMALAELPQASKWRKWCLRDFRKHQNGGNGVCGTSASISKSDFPPFDVRFLAIAWGYTKKQGLRCRIASPVLSISEKPTHRGSGAWSSCHLFNDLNHRRTHLNGVACLDEDAANGTGKVGRDVVLHLHGPRLRWRRHLLHPKPGGR